MQRGLRIYGLKNTEHAVGCNILTFIFPIFNLNKHKQRCFCCKIFPSLDFPSEKCGEFWCFCGGQSTLSGLMTFDNFVDIQNIYFRNLSEWLLRCSIIDQCLPVNGVAVLRHQTPNLHCCSPDYDVAIIMECSSVKSQTVENITPLVQGKIISLFPTFIQVLRNYLATYPHAQQSLNDCIVIRAKVEKKVCSIVWAFQRFLLLLFNNSCN